MMRVVYLVDWVPSLVHTFEELEDQVTYESTLDRLRKIEDVLRNSAIVEQKARASVGEVVTIPLGKVVGVRGEFGFER